MCIIQKSYYTAPESARDYCLSELSRGPLVISQGACIWGTRQNAEKNASKSSLVLCLDPQHELAVQVTILKQRSHSLSLRRRRVV